MAHVHGTQMVESAAKAARGANTPMMMGEMMGGKMGAMMEQGAGMNMAEMMAHRGMAAAATGAAVTATSAAKHSLIGRLIRNPWVVFGTGLAVGYLVHKYRQEIIDTATRAGEKGKDFVLQQRENLEDLVSASKEAADDAGKG
jgi:hypothetical protein